MDGLATEVRPPYSSSGTMKAIILARKQAQGLNSKTRANHPSEPHSGLVGSPERVGEFKERI
jgi:hypothetical protein